LRDPFRAVYDSLRPYGQLRRRCELQMFRHRERPRLESLKEMHKRERCFLIGNGPSLKKHDLGKLIGEKTFVTNMFVLHERASEIRPTYYCISDWVHWSKDDGFTTALRQGFSKLANTIFFFEYDAKRVAVRTPELTNRTMYYLFQDISKPVWDGQFITDIRQPVCWGRTIMIDFCIPLACYMGFKDIYLIGTDYDWNFERSGHLQYGYFYGIDEDDRNLAESASHKDAGTPDHVGLIMKAFEVVRDCLKDSNHNIYNAGHGGRLEVFPRVNYDDLF